MAGWSCPLTPRATRDRSRTHRPRPRRLTVQLTRHQACRKRARPRPEACQKQPAVRHRQSATGAGQALAHTTHRPAAAFTTSPAIWLVMVATCWSRPSTAFTTEAWWPRNLVIARPVSRRDGSIRPPGRRLPTVICAAVKWISLVRQANSGATGESRGGSRQSSHQLALDPSRSAPGHPDTLARGQPAGYGWSVWMVWPRPVAIA